MLTRCLAIVPSLIVALIGGSAGAGKLIIIASVRYLCHPSFSNFFGPKIYSYAFHLRICLYIKINCLFKLSCYNIMEVSHIFVTKLHCGHKSQLFIAALLASSNFYNG